MLTQTRLKEVLHYDPATGVFTRLQSRGNAAAGAVAGSPNNYGYPQVMVDGHLVSCQRLAWLYMVGEWPKGQIDHINGVRADNRWSNLRDVPPRMNSENRRTPNPKNTTGLIGVSRRGKRFVAYVGVNRKKIHLGTFDTAEEAHSAYVEGKRIHHEGCVL